MVTISSVPITSFVVKEVGSAAVATAQAPIDLRISGPDQEILNYLALEAKDEIDKIPGVVNTYKSWGIPAENQQYGTWRGWQRGITHIDLIEPRVRSLNGMQLAWSPGIKKPVVAEVVLLPEAQDSVAFSRALSQVKGKLVMVSMPQMTGRPDYNWEEFATGESFEKMKNERSEQEKAWRDKMNKTGYNSRTLIAALENAGAAGIITLNWSRGFGANKVFSASTKKTTPKNLMAKGEISSLAIQALREIGKDNLTEEEEEKIIKLLKQEKLELLEQDISLAPVWIQKIMQKAL